jgi:hypothetical protein
MTIPLRISARNEFEGIKKKFKIKGGNSPPNEFQAH